MNRIIVRALLFVLLVAGVTAIAAQQAAKPPLEKPVQLAEGVWIRQSNDIGKFGSNVGWIEFADFVVVIDTAFPLGAEEALQLIRAQTKKPIRYAVVTHYHADHSFGTGVFAKEGATIVAHENARREYLARNVENYRKTAEKDEAYARYSAYAPNLTFTDQFILDDGKRRAEILYLGHAHTTGCIFTWLPKEKVVFTGDACVNGPFNYMGDSDSASWIEVLGRAQALGAEKVGPGHGPPAGGDLLKTQQRYFIELREQVGRLVAEGKSLDEVRAAVDVPMWKAWTGEAKMNRSNIDHVYRELTRGGLSWAAGDPGVSSKGVVAIAKADLPAKLKYLTGPLPADQVEGLRQAAPNVELVVARSREEAMAAAPEVHACSGNFVNAQFLKAADNLRWVQQFSAGVEQLCEIPELVHAHSVVLTNCKVVFGPNIADHFMGLLLSLTRSLPHYQDLQEKGVWGKGSDSPYQGELKDKTLLLVGLGGIGSEVAKRAHACGMRVVALDAKEVALPAYVSRLEKPDRLDALLPTADVVGVCCPLTPETKGLFGSARFAAMKKGAFFVNIARGKIYDNQALADALKSGHLAGAGLDVTEPEPLPSDHALWKAPNCLITPHVAGQSPGSKSRIRGLFMENMRRFGAGEPLLNVVDKRAGY